MVAPRPYWYSAAMDDPSRKQRALARTTWVVSKHKLAEGPEDELDDLLATTTASERVAMVWRLTRDAWSLAGMPIPDYARSEAPGRVVHKHERG